MNDRNNLRDEADNLVYRMRELAGTGDIDAASEIINESFELLNDASAYDRTLGDEDEDAGVTLGYVLEMVHLVGDNVKGVPVGNRSRAARNAA